MIFSLIGSGRFISGSVLVSNNQNDLSRHHCRKMQSISPFQNTAVELALFSTIIFWEGPKLGQTCTHCSLICGASTWRLPLLVFLLDWIFSHYPGLLFGSVFLVPFKIKSVLSENVFVPSFFSLFLSGTYFICMSRFIPRVLCCSERNQIAWNK